jgi:hypothetical protein
MSDGVQIDSKPEDGRRESMATETGPAQIRGFRRVHCSYHKCLTVYFEKVLKRMVQTPFALAGGYRHFDSRLDAFYRDCGDYAVASINNHVLDLDRFENIRVTRFVRDPRDLIVSGYFFHKRSTESWCDVVDPTDEDWKVVGGVVPEVLGRRGGRESFREYLNDVSLEEGLLAELDFRRGHFESMRAWPKGDRRVEVFRYEDVLGREGEIFDRIFRFYELPFVARRIGLHYAHRFRATGRTSLSSDHIRDPRIGQWREVFTQAVTRRFDDEYGDLIERLGYARD